MTSSDQTVRSFFMKDLYDQGIDILKPAREPRQSGINSLTFLDGYTLMDEAIDVDGKPNYDYFIWTGLARLLITAGDLTHVAVKVTVSPGYSADVGRRWDFGYDLGPKHGGMRMFMSLYPIADTEVSVAEGAKPMGAVSAEEEYIPKLGAYPMMVNPTMGRRSTAALNFILAMALRQGGLTVTGHWIPEDTSTGEAVYLLSDGLVHYNLRYNGPALEQCLATIDALVGRTEEDGAIILAMPADADGLEPEDTEDGDIPDTGEDELAAPHLDLTDTPLPH